MKPSSIFTIGYEDRTIDEFLSRLKKHKITVLVDIREKPISRKRDFSKTKINDHLQSAGIKYLHISELGSPFHLRDKLHKDSDYDSFFKEYEKHLRSLKGVVANLYHDVISSNVTCLMCMERDPLQCHRLLVAKKVKQINGNGLAITHI